MKKQKRSIKVTKQHIKDGVPGNYEECPVALAIIETYEKEGYEVSDVEITGEHFMFTLYHSGEIAKGVSESHEITVELACPKAIAKFIEGFDAEEADVGTEYDEKDFKKLKKHVKPLEFTLPI